MIVAGLATNMPDLDIVLAPISSQLYLLHHRGETHSLLMLPLWALLLSWMFGKGVQTSWWLAAVLCAGRTEPLDPHPARLDHRLWHPVACAFIRPPVRAGHHLHHRSGTRRPVPGWCGFAGPVQVQPSAGAVSIGPASRRCGHPAGSRLDKLGSSNAATGARYRPRLCPVTRLAPSQRDAPKPAPSRRGTGL